MHIAIEDATVKYMGRKDPAFTGLTLQINTGETVLLLGASGCGKSTLALALNGLIPHSVGATMTGRVQVDGLDTQHASVADLSQKAGIVFQDPEAQFVTLRVEDEVVFGLENLRWPAAHMRPAVDAALAAVGMPDAHDREVFKLSGGEKQRIALASLLAMEPGVLIFDEPTANLDPVGTRDVFALLAEHQALHSHTMILIEHKLDELMGLIDRVVVLGQTGRVIADGAPEVVFDTHAGLLQQEGVWMPQVCLLAHALRARGVQLDRFPVTLDEAARLIAHVETEAAPESGVAPAAADRTAHASALDVRRLSFTRNGRVILDDVTFAITQGEYVALVGANGAGKTTLAQHLMGILTPPDQAVFVEGQDVRGVPPRLLIERVGYVFQNPEHQFVADSVFDEVAYSLRAKGLPKADVEMQTEAMLNRFGLLRLARANPFTLSHGQKRRLSVASMLAAGQRTLILDEPTFGQDQRNADALMHLLGDMNQAGSTLLVITHDMALVAEHAKRVLVMAAGRLIFDGTPSALFARPDVLRQARLTPPPIAQLAERVPALRGALTLTDMLARLSARTVQGQGAHA
jgi:energy-coupling factor transport system ATP-binding protein